MAYNYGYAMNYYPMQANAFQNVGNVGGVAPNAQSNGIIWVQGEAGAKSYMVAPNNTVQLWDSESQTIYLKSADASGMPSMRILDYTIRSEASNSPVKTFSEHEAIIPIREELNALKSRIDDLQSRFDSAFNQPRRNQREQQAEPKSKSGS